MNFTVVETWVAKCKKKYVIFAVVCSHVLVLIYLNGLLFHMGQLFVKPNSSKFSSTLRHYSA